MHKMYILIITLLVFSCENNARNIENLSLSDNESMMYDNYMAQQSNIKPQFTPEDTQPQQVYSPFIGQGNDASCMHGCSTPPLKIAVMPMGLATKVVMEEINNTVAFLNSNIDQRKYHISIIDTKQDFVKDFEITPPDIIIGPFTDEDVKNLDATLKQNKINVPVLALTTKVAVPSNNIKYFGYSVEDTVRYTVSSINESGIQSYGVLMPNTAIGSATYNLFKKHIEASGKQISRVEFYEEEAPDALQRYVDKVKMAVNQVYYVAQDGSIIEDDHSFTKKIKEENEKTVTLKDGTKYSKKYKRMGAIIIDGDPKYFETIFQMVSQDEAFENVLIVGSQRVVDSVIAMAQKARYETLDKEMLFPANYGFYKNFYNSYGEQFGVAPTRLGVTLYETAIYTITLHNKSDITQGLHLSELPVFVGLNGTMVLSGGQNSTIRYTNIAEFKNGKANEVIDTSKKAIE